MSIKLYNKKAIQAREKSSIKSFFKKFPLEMRYVNLARKINSKSYNGLPQASTRVIVMV
jgi:hypothetical protein